MKQAVELFGTTPDGARVERVTITGGGLVARVLSYGATGQDLRLDGVAHPLVLGAPTLAPYFDEMTYFGALVGRFANRIARGRFALETQAWPDAPNRPGFPSGILRPGEVYHHGVRYIFRKETRRIRHARAA